MLRAVVTNVCSTLCLVARHVVDGSDAFDCSAEFVCHGGKCMAYRAMGTVLEPPSCALWTLWVRSARPHSYTGCIANLTADLGWAFAVYIAIVISTGVSGAHLNPMVTIVMVAHSRFPRRKMPLYFGAQITAAFLAVCLGASGPVYSEDTAACRPRV